MDTITLLISVKGVLGCVLFSSSEALLASAKNYDLWLGPERRTLIEQYPVHDSLETRESTTATQIPIPLNSWLGTVRG